MISKYEILGCIAGCLLLLGAVKYVEYRIDVLEAENSNLMSQVEDLDSKLKAETMKREFAEVLLKNTQQLMQSNNKVEEAKVVYVDKIKQVDLKTVTATELNQLSDELEMEWQK